MFPVTHSGTMNDSPPYQRVPGELKMKRTILATAATGVLLLLTACSGDPSSEAGSTPTPMPTAYITAAPTATATPTPTVEGCVDSVADLTYGDAPGDPGHDNQGAPMAFTAEQDKQFVDFVTEAAVAWITVLPGESEEARVERLSPYFAPDMAKQLPALAEDAVTNEVQVSEDLLVAESEPREGDPVLTRRYMVKAFIMGWGADGTTATGAADTTWNVFIPVDELEDCSRQFPADPTSMAIESTS